MKLRTRIAVLSLFAWSFSAPSIADDPSLDRDIRCLVAVMKGTATGLLPKPTGELAALFFFARVDVRDPNIDLTSKMADLIKSMSQQEMGQEMVRCGGEMSDRGRKLTETGKALVAMGL